MSMIFVESYADCPFSICVGQTDLIERVLGDSETGGIRLTHRALGIPSDGSVPHAVTVRSHRRLDLSEPGRFHDEIDFNVIAESAWIPHVSGTLRFRIRCPGTRLLFVADYALPCGAIGRLVDRIVVRRLAVASAGELMDRLVADLEQLWYERQNASTHHPALRTLSRESPVEVRLSA